VQRSKAYDRKEKKLPRLRPLLLLHHNQPITHSVNQTMLIEIRAQILFITGILFLFRIINANLSRPLDKKAERLLQNICENLPYDSSYSKENQQWEKFCQNWIKSLDDDIHREIGKDGK
jgi:hypothetical protein